MKNTLLVGVPQGVDLAGIESSLVTEFKDMDVIVRNAADSHTTVMFLRMTDTATRAKDVHAHVHNSAVGRMLGRRLMQLLPKQIVRRPDKVTITALEASGETMTLADATADPKIE